MIKLYLHAIQKTPEPFSLVDENKRTKAKTTELEAFLHGNAYYFTMLMIWKKRFRFMYLKQKAYQSVTRVTQTENK